MANKSYLLFITSIFIMSCGGGGDKNQDVTSPPPQKSFSIGGTVTGALLASITLLNNDTEQLEISSAGTFTFNSMENTGNTYNVTVINDNLSQQCTITNASGNVSTSNVENIEINCSQILVSSDDDGIQMAKKDVVPTISDNGRFVLFNEDISNSVEHKIYIKDIYTGELINIKERFSKYPTDADFWGATISGDGEYVVFFSNSDDIVEEDINGAFDVFLHNIKDGTTTLVSSGNNSSDFSGWPSVSYDGRYVAFVSSSNQLVIDDNNNSSDIFIYDASTKQVSRISVDSDGYEANNSSSKPQISADGKFVVFESYASNLVEGDNNNNTDIFIHEIDSGKTLRVSVDSVGNEANNSSTDPAISADGKSIVFSSLASNLTFPNESYLQYDVFLHDLNTSVTSKISHIRSGDDLAIYGGGVQPKISANGRYVVFHSGGKGLVEEGTNGENHVFVFDIKTNETALVTRNQQLVEGNAKSITPYISGDGRYITFSSEATNLIETDSNGQQDIFLLLNPLIGSK